MVKRFPTDTYQNHNLNHIINRMWAVVNVQSVEVWQSEVLSDYK